MTKTDELQRLTEAIRDLRYRSSGGSYSRASRKGQALREMERRRAGLERRTRPEREPWVPPF